MGIYLPGLNFPIYSGWTQYTPVIPKLYWDVYSAEQRMKQLCMSFDKVEHYLDYVAALMNEWNLEFSEEVEEELTKMWDEIHSGYKEAINNWIVNDLPGIIQAAVNMVFFGCSEDGHYTVFIPESWESIMFNTGYDYSDKNTYGRLIFEMYVTDTFQVDGVPTDLIWEVQND